MNPAERFPRRRTISFDRAGYLSTEMILFARSRTSQKSTFSTLRRISETPDCLEMMTGTSRSIASSGRDAERLGDTRHDVQIAHRVNPLDLDPAHETEEMEIPADPQLGGPFDHSRPHVACSRHDERHIRHMLEDLGRRLDEVIRPLLEGDAPQEKHDLLPLPLPRNLDILDCSPG